MKCSIWFWVLIVFGFWDIGGLGGGGLGIGIILVLLFIFVSFVLVRVEEKFLLFDVNFIDIYNKG